MSVTFCGQHILVSTGKFDNVLRNLISIIIASLQIIFFYKPVVCQARDKVLPDI